MIIVIDGPEKAGKSTLVASLVKAFESMGSHVYVRKWGPVKPDDRVYLEPLRADCYDLRSVAIWDRSWAAEHVYGKLLGRDRRLAEDPWLGEWLYGRAVSSMGMKVMLTAEPHVLSKLRDDTDLPVEPEAENWAFLKYAENFDWNVFSTRHSPESLDHVTRAIVNMMSYSKASPGLPPSYAGPAMPRIIFVGEARSKNPQMVGSWLPFTSRYTTEFARMMGNQAMHCGWTNCHEIAPQPLRRAQIIVSCGEVAAQWVRHYVITPKSDIVHISLPHPSWTFRYNNENTAQSRAMVREVLRVLAHWSEWEGDVEAVIRLARNRGVLQRA